jgi:hypothetical protein
VGSINYDDKRSPKVTKSSIDKFFNKLGKNVLEPIFSNFRVVGRNPWHL